MFQAEARLAAKRAARAEAREIRMKELERQQKEVTRPRSLLTPVAIDTPVPLTLPMIGMRRACDLVQGQARERA